MIKVNKSHASYETLKSLYSTEKNGVIKILLLTVMYIGESESSKFWLSVMNDLKSRGVKKVYLFCVDGLSGMAGKILCIMKMLYLASINISKKWTVRYKNWDQVLASLNIMFGEKDVG